MTVQPFGLRDIEPRLGAAASKRELHNAIAHVRNCERTRRSVAFITTEVFVSLGRCACKGAADRDVIITSKGPAYVRSPLEPFCLKVAARRINQFKISLKSQFPNVLKKHTFIHTCLRSSWRIRGYYRSYLFDYILKITQVKMRENAR